VRNRVWLIDLSEQGRNFYTLEKASGTECMVPGRVCGRRALMMGVRLCCICSLTAAATTITAAAAAAEQSAVASGGPSAPMRMRVEYMDRPLGVDVCGGGDGTAAAASPLPLRFTWSAVHTARQQRQTAYQLVVAAKGVDSCGGDNGSAVVWDSGTVRSNVSQNVPMGSGGDTSSSPSAQLLAPARAYCWGVRWWDANGAVSPWSYSSFSTGLFTEADWHGAAWLGASHGAPAGQTRKWQIGQFRKNFTVRGAVARATAYVVGLGYYQLHLNGRLVSRHELGTFTTFDRRVMYDTLDVTEAINGALAEPEQVLGLTLGNGWYNLGMTDPFDGGHPINIGPPTLRVRLSLQYLPSGAAAPAPAAADNVVTDTSWMHTPGPTTFAHIFMGTVYNASRETPGWTRAHFVPGADWAVAEVVPPPSDHLILSSHAVMPPIRTIQRITPCQMWQSSPGVFVYDFCQNMAGYATLRVPDGVATEPHVPISMVHAEAIHGPPANHSAIFNHFYRGKQTVGGKSFEMNTYVTRGDGAAIEWSPRFTYAGFRYHLRNINIC
jgi:alpha-L-rhamnosidase